MAKDYEIAVLGGGAAGLAASIAAAREGRSVVLVDRMPRLGRKLLATGGGRCNLANENLSPSPFSSTSPDLVSGVLGQVGLDEILDFFRSLGLWTAAETERVFPAANQASSVLKVLELEVRRLGFALELGFEVVSVAHRGEGFVLSSIDHQRVEARTVILAAGGKSYPALGSNGSGYDLARKFGHRIVPPVPSGVPLVVKNRMCQALQGQKIKAGTSAWIEGKKEAEASGELLFTAYGLSGTAVIDVSERISIALHREKKGDVRLVADLVPFLTRQQLAVEIGRRLDNGWPRGELVTGILPEKFGPIVASLVPAESTGPGGEAAGLETASALAAALKEKRFTVSGTRGWNEAEFTSGGIDAREVDPGSLESRPRPGLFFAGEILDVQGPRGGFNLAWAWASGLVAGRAAALGL